MKFKYMVFIPLLFIVFTVGYSNASAGARDADMVYIKGGTFQMGSSSGRLDEQVVHTVRVSDFFIKKYAETQSEYINLMDSAYSNYTPPVLPAIYGVSDSNPIYKTSWFDAVLYCNAKSKRDMFDTVYTYDSITGVPGSDCVIYGVKIDYSKFGYRLPTEAEWEYACRAGTATDYYWGNEDPTKYAWFIVNSGLDDIDGNKHTHPVGQLLPNGYGLYDMAGNVYQWCNDWYDTTYQIADSVDPKGPATGPSKCSRGGSFSYSATYLRSASRMEFLIDHHYYYYGLRLAMNYSPSATLPNRFGPGALHKNNSIYRITVNHTRSSKFKLSADAKTVEIYSITGKKVRSINCNQQKIEFFKLGEGSYVIREIR